MSEVYEAQGWEAIDKLLGKLYGSQEPRHYGTVVKWASGGPDPLDGVSVYLVDGPIPHWHYVSFGLSELYQKESNTPEYSGFGFELTFRLRRDQTGFETPTWPIGLMQNLARYVFQTGNIFQTGHRIPTNGPILVNSDTELQCVMFITDSQLGSINTANGKLEFLQIVGTTMDEYDAAQAWNTLEFLKLLARDNPLLVTDLKRTSILNNPTLREIISDGIQRDGSSCGSLFLSEATVTRAPNSLALQIRRQHIDTVRIVMEGRLKHGRELYVTAQDLTILLRPGNATNWKETAEGIEITCSPPLVDELVNKLAIALPRYEFAGLPNLVITTV